MIKNIQCILFHKYDSLLSVKLCSTTCAIFVSEHTQLWHEWEDVIDYKSQQFDYEKYINTNSPIL